MEAHMLRQEEETSLQGAPDAVRDEINARFDRQGVEKKARKVNASLDELSEQMRRFDEAAENKENQ
jgi:primosomal protein N''